MGQFDAGSIVGTLDVDRSPFTQGLELAKAQGDAFSKKRLVQNVDVNTGDSIPKLMALRGAADAASGASGGAGGSAGGGLGFLMKTALVLAPTLAPIGTVLTGLVGGLVGLGAVVGVAAGAMSVVAKPFISNIQALATAQTNYNNAVSTYGANSAQAKSALAQLDAQMKGATPSVQAGAKAWSDFQTFYKQWAASFQPTLLPLLVSGLNLAKTALKDLTPAIKGIASGLKDFVGQLQLFLSSTPALQFFKFLGQAMSQLGGVLGGVVANALAGFMALLQAAWPLIQIVANLLLEATKAFSSLDWNGILGPLVKNFQILAPIVGKFFQSVIEIVGALLKAIAPIGVAMFQVISAAVQALMPVLQALGKIIAVIAPVVSLVAVALAQFLGVALKALAPIIIDLLPIIGKLVTLVGGALINIFKVAGPAIASILGVLGQFLKAVLSIFDNPAVIKGMQAFLSDISPLTFVFPALGQSIGQLAPVFGALAKAVGNIAGPLANIAGQFLSLAGTVLQHLVPVLVPLVAQTLTALVGVLNDLAPYLPTLAKLFSQTVLNVITSLAAPLASVVQEVLPVLASTLAQLAPFIPTLATVFSQALVSSVQDIAPVLPQVASAFATLVKVLTPIFVGALSGVVKAFGGLPKPVQGAAFGLALMFTPLSKVVPLLGPMAKALGSLTKALFGFIKNLSLSTVQLKLMYLWDGLVAIATKVWTGIQAIFNVVMDANPLMLVVLGLAALVAAVILVIKYWTPISHFFEGIWKDIKKFFDEGVNFVKKHWKDMVEVILIIMTGGMATVPVLIFRYWKQITEFTSKLWNDITGFFSRIWHVVVGLVTNLYNDVTGFFKRLWHDSVGFVSNLINDVVNFFTSLPDKAAKGAVKMWDWIKESFRGVIDTVIGWWNDFVGMLKIPAFHLPHIPGLPTIGFGEVDIGKDLRITPLAAGGLALSPTLAAIAEGGQPEAVLPLDKLSQYVNPKATGQAIQEMTQVMGRLLSMLLTVTKNLPADTADELSKSIGSVFDKTTMKSTRTLIAAARQS